MECFSHLKRPFVWMLLAALEAIAQSDDGRLRIKVTDRLGIGISCTLDLASEGNHYRQTFATGEDGRLTVSDLRPGDYLLQIDEPGFAPVLRSIRVGATNSVAILLEPLAGRPRRQSNPANRTHHPGPAAHLEPLS